MTYLLVTLTLLFNLLVTPAIETGTLQTITLYDPDNDGHATGIGKGYNVWIYQNDRYIDSCITDQDSSCSVVLPYGTYETSTIITGRLLSWLCQGSVTLNVKHRYHLVECKKVVTFMLPFVIK